MRKHRQISYALLRVTLGLVFFFFGFGKFRGGVGQVAAGMQQQFEGKLPGGMVAAFAYALPFAEVIIGTLLILGLFTEVGLILAGLLMLALVFGTVMGGMAPTAASNAMYGLIVFVLMWAIDYNTISLDRALGRKYVDTVAG